RRSYRGLLGVSTCRSGRRQGRRGIHRGLDGEKELASDDLLVALANRVEIGKALVYLGAASLAFSPQAHVHDKAPVTDVENLEGVHPDALPGLPQLVPLAAHALVASKRPGVSKD